MMSAPRAQLELGVNFVLTEFLYQFAYGSGMKYVNWQASNPPVGSLVEFKKSWNAHELRFPVYSKIWDTGVTRAYLEKEFTDCYVFPYAHLIEGK